MGQGRRKPSLPSPHPRIGKANALTVEQLCLSILYEGEATGYDIRRHFREGEAALFADASIGAIYPALAKLEAKGLVGFVIEEQIGKPSRKVYRITEAGRQTFVAALREPLTKDKYQSAFLHFLRFAHLAPCDIVAAHIEARQQLLDEELLRLETMLSHPSDSPQGGWMLEYALSVTEAMRDGLDNVVRKICADPRYARHHTAEPRSSSSQ